MPDFNDPQSAYVVLALVVPGLVITFIRAQFITGRMQKHSEALLSYFALSAVYAAIALPIFDWLRTWSKTGSVGLPSWFGLVFVGPTLFGALLGLNARTEALRRVLHFFGINPVHAVPTAWDWKFGRMGEHLVIVTLKDDTKFAGYCGRGSFMSSDPAERDLYIEKVYGWGERNSWLDRGDHGLWVASGELKSVEFFPASEEGTSNG
ncbi:MAG: hypothetical protein GC146_13325 [Limimaricola sp.]|uniref:DUF6338 family protein n=1 Tax=Limimaricola sp. TaxID=2211665 RepID=UPI001D7BAEAA|nr:DUF6338 family protein [Limimaricola sp.]MBI1418196.1 hypothetical protein [Limimaricola sp.]